VACTARFAGCSARFEASATTFARACGGARRLRVGDYRVIHRIEPPDLVLLLQIAHRREVYEQ